MKMPPQADDCSIVTLAYDEAVSRVTSDPGSPSSTPSSAIEDVSVSIASFSSGKNCFDATDFVVVTPPFAVPAVSEMYPPSIATVISSAAPLLSSPPSITSGGNFLQPPSMADSVFLSPVMSAMVVATPPAVPYPHSVTPGRISGTSPSEIVSALPSPPAASAIMDATLPPYSPSVSRGRIAVALPSETVSLLPPLSVTLSIIDATPVTPPSTTPLVPSPPPVGIDTPPSLKVSVLPQPPVTSATTSDALLSVPSPPGRIGVTLPAPSPAYVPSALVPVISPWLPPYVIPGRLAVTPPPGALSLPSPTSERTAVTPPYMALPLPSPTVEKTAVTPPSVVLPLPSPILDSTAVTPPSEALPLPSPTLERTDVTPPSMALPSPFPTLERTAVILPSMALSGSSPTLDITVVTQPSVALPLPNLTLERTALSPPSEALPLPSPILERTAVTPPSVALPSPSPTLERTAVTPPFVALPSPSSTLERTSVILPSVALSVSSPTLERTAVTQPSVALPLLSPTLERAAVSPPSEALPLPSPTLERTAVTPSSVALPSPCSTLERTAVTSPFVVLPSLSPTLERTALTPPSVALLSPSPTLERTALTPPSVALSVSSPTLERTAVTQPSVALSVWPATSAETAVTSPSMALSVTPPTPAGFDVTEPFLAASIPSLLSITPGKSAVTLPPEALSISSMPEEIPVTQPSTLPEVSSPPSLKPPQIPISWPTDGILTLDWILDTMAVFDWFSRNLSPTEFPSVCPVTVFDSLVLRASKLLHKEPNCVRIDPGVHTSKVVVVGDVHGQLHDVLFLLQTAGFPSEDCFYVFNGDYVDRGAWGLETFLVLLGWKVFLPNRVFLLRGNHESKYCTSVYGFEKEVMVKYGTWGRHAYRKCLGCFEGLPLASIIAGCVYTAHGGIFRSIPVKSKRCKGKKNRRISINSELNTISIGSLEELLRARRSVLDPPWEGYNLIPGDVLWSDPSMNPGFAPNTKRGIGLLWGPDCTEEFLKKFNLKLIIRSHEGPDARERRTELAKMDDGYTIDHVVESGKLITLFSAPDYPQFQATEERYKNKGAYIVLEPPDFNIPLFYTFEAINPRPKASSYYDFEDVIDSDGELDLALMVPCS